MPSLVLPKICVALGCSDPDALLSSARHLAEDGESFFEFRLDYLPDPHRGIPVIQKFLSDHPEARVLATCRRLQNQGRFQGSIEEEIRILESAVDAGARAVDVETQSAQPAAAAVQALRKHAFLIVSYHKFDGTPALEPLLRRLQRTPADAYKLVTSARKPSDNLRILSLARSHNRPPMILLAMDEMGFPTRVLSPAWGGLFTFAAPWADEGTASGQVAARTLRTLYRADKLSRDAKVYGVLADPVCHSLSPALHNRAFQARRLPAVYLPFLAHPPQLKDFMLFAGKLPVAGFSVTIPHKQKILRYLDHVDPLARRIGAVNTVWRKGGKWRGANTDTDGILAPLGRRLRPSKASVLIAGNGGAARAAAFALADAGARVSIVGRNPEHVRPLARACSAEPLALSQLKDRRFDVLIHSTPLGMFPHTQECFFPDAIPAEVVFDMVYNPLETVLLRRAREQGKAVIPGLEMFVEQAVRQFEIWTSQSAPRALMERAVLDALGAHALATGHTMNV